MNSIEHSEGQDTWRLVATGTTTPIEDNTPKIINVCNCPELGYWCAEYITAEMKKNLYTPEGEKLLSFTTTANPITAYDNLPLWRKIFDSHSNSIAYKHALESEENALRYWKDLVGYNCIWDHKPALKENLKRILKERDFSVEGSLWAWSKLNNFDYYYDIWSNIHYGFIGVHAGFLPDSLTAGASAAQYMNDRGSKSGTQYHPENGALYNRYDDISDQISIKIGIELAKERTPQNLSISDLINKIESIPAPWGSEDSPAKRKHQCLHLL